ncbi:hypothetical protein J6590_099848, partial [Homalodisca vitripennis]
KVLYGFKYKDSRHNRPYEQKLDARLKSKDATPINTADRQLIELKMREGRVHTDTVAAQLTLTRRRQQRHDVQTTGQPPWNRCDRRDI